MRLGYVCSGYAPEGVRDQRISIDSLPSDIVVYCAGLGSLGQAVLARSGIEYPCLGGHTWESCQSTEERV